MPKRARGLKTPGFPGFALLASERRLREEGERGEERGLIINKNLLLVVVVVIPFPLATSPHEVWIRFLVGTGQT